MSFESNDRVLIREDYPEAIVLRVGCRVLREDVALTALRDALYREAESADRPLVLDFTGVEFLSSAAVGWLIVARRRMALRVRPFQPPCRRRGLFAIYPDAAAALDAIRQGESDPLVLCAVRPAVAEVFVVC
jgi:anti-anti-sigma regulatory factor